MDRGPNYLAYPLPVPAHPLPVRVMHWIGATGVICMILSGWATYDASPLLPFAVPRWMSLGGGIAWHLSAMSVLFADGLGPLWQKRQEFWAERAANEAGLRAKFLSFEAGRLSGDSPALAKTALLRSGEDRLAPR